MNSPKNNCLNCGKYSHIIKYCKEPILSCGIICFNIDPMVCDKLNIIKYFNDNSISDVEEYNRMHINNLLQNSELISSYYNMIKILMVRRKHSLNYIEFLRGKYELETIKNHNIFKLMSYDEIQNIKTNNFDILWNELWTVTANHKIYKKEYNLSKKKFNVLMKNNFYNLLDCMDDFKYMEPEWGFPKGRKNMDETNLDCAKREFNEETHINLDSLNIIDSLNVTEDYIGTNMKNYRHIYYMANTLTNIEVSQDNVQLTEIGDIAWVTIPEAIEKIRPYHDAKIKIIHQIYFFIINIIIDISSNNMVLLHQ
jgi:ADP-ribose pyrophosphatase YjhB (NUDIX family)